MDSESIDKLRGKKERGSLKETILVILAAGEKAPIHAVRSWRDAATLI
jgi:hypothetical protein